MILNDYTFRAATPVWEIGTAHIMNRTLAFCADIPATSETTTLALSGCTEWILTVNGRFVAHGPARCAHGHFRVDEYDITPYLTEASNRVAIRVAGYNVNAYSDIKHPSFLCAEILCGDQVLAATGKHGFVAYGVDERLTRVQRYSFQRTFVETYRLAPGAFDYTLSPETEKATVAVEPAEAGRFIRRDIPYSDDETVSPVSLIHRGKVSYSDKAQYFNSREISNISDKFFGYREDELEYASHHEYGKCDYSDRVAVSEPVNVINLPADSFADIEFPCNTTGIYEFDIEAKDDATLFIVFDEILVDDDVRPYRMGFSNFITVECKAGRYHLLCAMPHVMKYARLIAKNAEIILTDLHLHHIAYPQSAITARFIGEDDAMRNIYNAAIESFRANAVDVYMDCPSRERAGWLCDSFFTSRVEHTLTGKSVLERAFLQNFLMPETFEHLPEGMLPMCYPSDHNDGNFIPNWAMWYGVELREYLARSGDRALIEDAKPRMYALLDYFKRFENEYGLLEKLESWVFLEWSKSNELTQDVSFASNMLYARFCADIGTLYDDPALIDKAAALRKTILDMSMTESGFFCDNAYRRDGGLVLSGERTESCQYYAFFCDIATPDSHPWLWNTLIHDFGYDRAARGLYPEIYPANAFIGNYLRLDLLDRYGLHEALFDNIKGYFTYMADTTGTLWEHAGSYASCNHGFASHVIYWMDKLGLLTHD